MSQLKLLGLAILATLTLGTVAVSVAQADLKGLPEKAKGSFKSIGGGTLKTLSGKELKCSSLTGTGEGVSERLGLGTTKLTGCTGPLGVKCTGLSDTEGNITLTGESHLRHLLPASEGVNTATLGTAHFSCLGILFIAKGCIASMALLTKENGVSVVNLLLATGFTEFLNENPTSIDTDNGLGMENCVLMIKEGNAAEESAGIIGKGTAEKCEVGGVACTGLIDLTGGAP